MDNRLPGPVRCNIEVVGGWGQRVEPRPQTPIYQNTRDGDNLPKEAGMFLDHSWRESPVSTADRVGIYLGFGLVATVTLDPIK